MHPQQLGKAAVAVARKAWLMLPDLLHLCLGRNKWRWKEQRRRAMLLQQVSNTSPGQSGDPDPIRQSGITNEEANSAAWRQGNVSPDTRD